MADTNWIYLSNNRYAPKIAAEDIEGNEIEVKDNAIYINGKKVTEIYCSDGSQYLSCNVYIGDTENKPKQILTKK